MIALSFTLRWCVVGMSLALKILFTQPIPVFHDKVRVRELFWLEPSVNFWAIALPAHQGFHFFFFFGCPWWLMLAWTSYSSSWELFRPVRWCIHETLMNLFHPVRCISTLRFAQGCIGTFIDRRKGLDLHLRDLSRLTEISSRFVLIWFQVNVATTLKKTRTRDYMSEQGYICRKTIRVYASKSQGRGFSLLFCIFLYVLTVNHCWN